MRFRLTGEAKGEITDYSGANLVNLHTRQYDPELLKLFGLEGIMDALPPLCNSVEIAGYVSEEAAALCGLKAGRIILVMIIQYHHQYPIQDRKTLSLFSLIHSMR